MLREYAPALGYTYPKAHLSVQAKKSYGKGRYSLSWFMSFEMGKVRLKDVVVRGTARSFTKCLREARAAIPEDILDRLWAEGLKRDKSQTFYDAKTGEPVFCLLGWYWGTSSPWPDGKYIAVDHEHGDTLYIYDRHLGSTFGHSVKEGEPIQVRSWDFEPVLPKLDM
jgi:hypothetical protein